MDGRVGGIYSPDLLRARRKSRWSRCRSTSSRAKPRSPRSEKKRPPNSRKRSSSRTSTSLPWSGTPTREANTNITSRCRYDRAEALRAYLQSHGISAQINVDGKGPDEPFDASLLGRSISQDEEYALDRRVEWVRHSTSE